LYAPGTNRVARQHLMGGAAMASDGPRAGTEQNDDAPYQSTLERLTTIAQITNPVVGANPLPIQTHELLQQVRSAYQLDACIARTLEG